jgi:hypothetical protein
MGGVYSSIAIARAVLQALISILKEHRNLAARVYADPGLPHPNPVPSFWQHQKASLPEPLPEVPEFADIVIIGSGITGASIARTILATTQSVLSPERDKKLQVVVLDSRDTCNGATGRNGGHIK